MLAPAATRSSKRHAASKIGTTPSGRRPTLPGTGDRGTKFQHYAGGEPGRTRPLQDKPEGQATLIVPHRAPAFLSRVGGNGLRGALGLAAFLGAWELLASVGWINAVLLPAPTTLFWAADDLLRSGTLLRHVGASIERVLVGFAMAAVVGLALGVLLGWFRTLSDFFKPLVEALRPIPPIAWTPLAILWFGVGNAPSYFLVFVGAVFPVFVSTFSAVRNIEQTQINAALCLGATPRMLIWDVLIPGALPVIFPGLRIALGVGWMCVVAAELIAAQSGLGYMIQQSRLLLQTQYVVTGMIVIGVIGFAMNGVMTVIERRLVPWQQSSRGS